MQFRGQALSLPAKIKKKKNQLENNSFPVQPSKLPNSECLMWTK